MSDQTCCVLFLCTGNSARSIMAESLLNREGGRRLRAFSAGSRPTGAVHPLTLAVLSENGHPVAGLRSKSWDEFARPGAPPIDLVVTVCDNAAGEVCPIWPGHPARIHLGFPDPAAAAGSEAERLALFRAVYRQIEAKVRRLIALGPERAAEV